MTNNKTMRILIACECSGTVRDAFIAQGHDAYSCDIKPDEKGSNRHITADVLDVINPDNALIYGKWDMLAVMHPPCTRLCNSGVRWLKVPPPGKTLANMWDELDSGAALFDACLNADIAKVAIENPVMHKYAKERINFNGVTPFYVQPWQFADDESSQDNEKKRTGFWCKGLDPLKPTGKLDGTTARNSVHFASPGKNRAADRSRFFPGMAAAMAQQWGQVINAHS